MQARAVAGWRGPGILPRVAPPSLRAQLLDLNTHLGSKRWKHV